MWLFGLYRNSLNKKISIDEFKNIFLEFFPELCLYATKFVGDTDISKDIVHDVLERFWLENEKLTNKNLIKPYLFKAVKNRSLNYNKREKRKTGLDEILGSAQQEREIPNDSDVISEISFKNLQLDLQNAVNELPAQRQIIFRMSRFEQKKHKKIAVELGISTKTVETQIYRSLRFLQEKLKHHLDER